jgi:hypothetical protein
MGGCACTERSAYFDKKTQQENRTDMLIKYLRPRSKPTIKHQVSSGDEGDEESGTEGSLESEVYVEPPKQVMAAPRPAVSYAEPPKQKLIVPRTPSPLREEITTFKEESPVTAAQPSLTVMSPNESLEEEKHEVVVKDRKNVVLTRLIRPRQGIETRQEVIKQSVIEKPVIKQPVIEKPVIEKPVIAKPVIAKPVIAKPVIEEPVIEEPVIEEQFVKKTQAPVYQEFAEESKEEVEEFIEARMSLGGRQHYLRTPAAKLTPELYERNMMGILTYEEEMEYLPHSRNSVLYSPVQPPEDFYQ